MSHCVVGKDNSWTAWPRRRKHSGPSKRLKLFIQRHSLTSRKTWIFSNTADRTSNLAFFRSLVQSNACRNYVSSSLSSVNTSWMQARMRSHTLVVSSRHDGHCNWMSLSAISVIAVKQIKMTVVRL